MTQLSITFLGTGGSWPTVRRNVTSIAVKRGSDILLFDCGEGTQRQFQSSGLSYMQVRHIFITHYHGDHFLGLPGLIQTMQLNDRTEPLHLYGPGGMTELLEQLMNLGYFKPHYEIVAHDLTEDQTIDFDGYKIETTRSSHGVPGLIYRLVEDKRPGKFDKPKALSLGIPEGPLFGRLQRGETITLDDGSTFKPSDVLGPLRPGRTIVISGDTRFLETMKEFSKDADVLIHEATYTSEFSDLAYHYGHTTAQQAALLAKDAGVGRLYLTHISPRYTDSGPILTEAKRIFANSMVPDDFFSVDVMIKQ